MPYSSPTFVLIASAVLAAGSVAVLAWRQRPEPGSVTLTLLMVAAAWWSATHLGTLAAGTFEGTLLWARLQWFGSVTLPVAWVLFALEYTGRDRYLRPSVVAGLAVLPLLTLVLVWTDGSHGLVRESAMLVEHGSYLVLESVWGPWFFVVVGYSYLLAAIGSVLFVQLAIGSSLLYRSQAAALLAGAALPWLSHLVYLGGLVPGTGLDLMAVSFVGSGIALLFALSKGKLLEATPAASRLASEFVMEGLDDGVVVVDSRGHVVDLNPSAAAILGANVVGAIGEPATAVVPEYDDGPSADVDFGIEIETDGSPRRFDVQVSVLEDYHGRIVGRAVVLRDVTERWLHRQRLAVLHRLLRHNLRNEMTLIRGHAEGLDTDGDDGPANAIADSARRVIDLSEKAARIERMVDESDEGEEPETVSLSATVTETVRSLRQEYPGTRFDVRELPAVDCPRPVAAAVRNLVENAAQHNTNDDPVVTIEAAVEGGDTVRITVTDNGPGIPPVERRVLGIDEETPLEHGSGIGLWLVNWAITTLGGTVEFDANEPTGSVVTVRVPLPDAGE